MDLFDLYAKISMDTSEYYNNLDEAGSKTSAFADKLKTGLATAAKVGAAGLATAAAGITALTKQSVENYAEYEQLVGGVETLFGKSADTVMKYAESAYKTAGLSANEYMATVTSFSASLLQSVGGDTEKAADYANRALTDMSDNANKMGTSMELIQNAYNGFAKANYTMLDNLKLGYGGTKEEMARLIEEAAAMTDVQKELGIAVDATDMSFGNIVNAISVVQKNMKITGTTADEAGRTIAGSVQSMKSAWANLVTGLGDSNADINVLLDNFIDSVGTTGKNLFSAIQRILTNIFATLEERGPDMLAEGVLLLGKLAAGLIAGIPDLVKKIPEIIKKIVVAFQSRSSEFNGIGQDIVKGVWNGIASLASWIKTKVSNFFGGIVDNVKGVLGIHSPSRVFAGIGENMALGVGEGWDNEYSSIKKGIEGGLDFGMANVDFSKSGFNFSAGKMLESAYNEAKEIKIVVQSVLDGRVIGESAYQYNLNRQRAYGGAY